MPSPLPSRVTRSAVARAAQKALPTTLGATDDGSSNDGRSTDRRPSKRARRQAPPPSSLREDDASQKASSDAKWRAWSRHAHSSPFPDFAHPTQSECQTAHDILDKLHGDTVRKNWLDEDPATAYPHVMQGVVIAVLSQATSWANAQRAMKSMTATYGSPYAYQEILDGGLEKLQATLRPGGMQNRKAKMLTQLLHDVKQRHGDWNIDHLFSATDDDAVKELLSYKGVGPKSAFCVLSIIMQRKSFAVDTHIYRITGLWGWRPASASREQAQAHLDAHIPDDIKFALHYLFIVHGRECPVCRGNGNKAAKCEFKQACSLKAKEESG